jgi:hypothetical protein
LAVVTELLDTITDLPDLGDNDTKRTRARRGVGIGVSVITSGLAVAGQHLGWYQDTPPPIEAMLDSTAHLGVGYIGALATVWAADHLRHKPPTPVSAIIGTTAANFSVEAMQDGIFNALNIPGSGEVVNNFLDISQRAETAKDYGFALLGLGVYGLSEWLAKRAKDKGIILPTKHDRIARGWSHR